MAKLIWLKNTQSCKLNLGHLKDYAGQPLHFTMPGTPMSRRCVTEETFRDPMLQQYVGRILANEATAPAAPPAAPAVEVVPKVAVKAPVVVKPEIEVVPSLEEDKEDTLVSPRRKGRFRG
jgi:hypothetical protein